MVKLAIVVRKELHLRRGEEITQSITAAERWLVERIVGRPEAFSFTEAEREWLHDTKRPKVTLQVDTEQELVAVAQRADEAGLEVHMHAEPDAKGQPVKTCLAIGPDLDERIDSVTGNLRLY
jgi:PTH2 family peptidyl-tRNA hydrolase